MTRERNTRRGPHRKLQYRCTACDAMARATEVCDRLMEWTPRCPAGHGEMAQVQETPKRPNKERKPRWIAWHGKQRPVKPGAEP